MKTTLKTAFALAAVAATLAAHAVAADAASQVRVSYADLNLASSGGRAALESRVAHAVERVCGARPLPVELNRQAAFETCRHTAWSGARQQMAAIYNGRNVADASVSIRGR